TVNRQESKGEISAEQAAKRREMGEKMKDARYLLTRAAIFDPLVKEPEPINIGGISLETTNFKVATARLKKSTIDQSAKGERAEARGYFIVQYRSAIQPAWVKALVTQDIEIAGYLPNNAYIVKASPDNIMKLQGSGAVRWIGAYGAGLKVAPELLTMTEDRTTDVIHISLLSFKGESAIGLREAINQLSLTGEPIIEERDDERAWAALAVQREDLARSVAALANIEGVESIEPRRPHHLQDDNGVRAVQTGYVSNDTPLYRQGLTGSGQIYGTADTGLDGDHSQFRLDGNAASQTLSYAATSASLSNGLLPFRITNQNNKVLVYYLLGSTTFKDPQG